MVWRWAIHRFWLPRGFPQHFWFSCSTSWRNWSTSPRKVLMCCLLSLTWIATSSIICRRILWAPPDRLVMTASPDTISFNRAQMYWNRRWFLTEERKSKRWTASPSPLKPAISRVQRRTIWQWGGTTSGSPSVAFLNRNQRKIVLLIDFFHFLVQCFLFLITQSDFSPLRFALQHLELLPVTNVRFNPFLAVRTPVLGNKWHFKGDSTRSNEKSLNWRINSLPNCV